MVASSQSKGKGAGEQDQNGPGENYYELVNALVLGWAGLGWAGLVDRIRRIHLPISRLCTLPLPRPVGANPGTFENFFQSTIPNSSGLSMGQAFYCFIMICRLPFRHQRIQ